MKHIYKYSIYIMAVILLSSCYPLRRVGLVQDREGLPEYTEGEYTQYKLQKNDELEFRVISLNEETVELFQTNSSGSTSMTQSFTYRIYEDGTIDIPFLSKVKVEGLTLREAEHKLETELKGFADDIRVKLSLATGTFCVIGDAGRGYFPIYKDRMTIYQALALCGGIDETADFAHVKILRRSDKGTNIVEFDIRSKSIIDSEYYYIYPNDVLYLDYSKRRFWGINSYSAFLGVISSSLSMLISVWNTFFWKIN